ncbi:Gfo/Idh/MocA family oxidoreductase [Micrococcales bacterium 31B]|nr:Gfo/Idh/MocA family oxidoreductase [Micrococcales bacterium 31B]
MTIKIGVLGVGQFAPSFMKLWNLHPDVAEIYCSDALPERAERAVTDGFATRSFATFDELLASDIDAVALFTQRWTHGPLAVQALEAGKHVYSAVPMAISEAEIEAIIAAVEASGKTYMLGETSFYNAAVVYVRRLIEAGDLGRVFYGECDYVHDMDNGFYAAYRYSGGDDWKKTASYPPMLYPTHAVGGVLGAWNTHAVSVSCIGIADDRGDGVFDKNVSMFGNEWSNMSAHFEMADGGVMRTNEFRRVGHPAFVPESRVRIYGTEKVFEQGNTGATLASRDTIEEVGDQIETSLMRTNWLLEGEEKAAETREAEQRKADAVNQGIDPALLHSFESGCAPAHDRSQLPASYEGAPNGHEGAHHFLADDFVRAIKTGQQPPVNAWVGARFNLPGIVAMESAKQGGARLPIRDFGDGPQVTRVHR